MTKNKQKKKEEKGKAVYMPSPLAALTVSLCSCLREAKSPKHTHTEPTQRQKDLKCSFWHYRGVLFHCGFVSK